MVRYSLDKIKSQVAKLYGYNGKNDPEFIERMHLFVDEIAKKYAFQFQTKEIKEVVISNPIEKTIETFDIKQYFLVRDKLPHQTMKVDVVIGNKTFHSCTYFKELGYFGTEHKIKISNITHWKPTNN